MSDGLALLARHESGVWDDMRRFYWVVEGRLAGCSRPNLAIADDLAWLRDQGIGAVLTLTEQPLPTDLLARNGLVGLHIPVDDMTAPTPAQLDEALDFIHAQIQLHAVAVHCLMGMGRTGTVLAAYLIRHGASPDDAIRHIRSLCDGAICTPGQERALANFAAARAWII